jgi:predicted dehydrogenase
VRYGERVLATFYHSFNQIGRYEQTTIRLTCTRGHITIEGWIPTRLMLTGAVGEDGLATLRDLFGERLVIRESFEGADAIFRHGGTTDRVAAFVEAMANAPQRQEEYKWAIQAGMRDFVAAIHENRPPHVGARDGLLSLAVALAASHTGASEPAFQPPV